MQIELTDKIYGCLIGGIIGDKLAQPFSGWNPPDYAELERAYGRISDLRDGQGNWGQTYRYTGADQLYLREIISYAYIEKKGTGITANDIAKRLIDKLPGDDFRLHAHDPMELLKMRTVVELLKKGESPRVIGMLSTVIGSTLAEISPVGLFNACDPEKAFEDGRECSSFYCRGLDREFSSVVASIIAEAMKRDATIDSVIEMAVEKTVEEAYYAGGEPIKVREIVRKALRTVDSFSDIFQARKCLYAEIASFKKMPHFIVNCCDPLEIFILTLCVLKITRGSAKEALIGAVNVGRASTAIGDLCGTITGALHGASSLPVEWVESAEEATGYKFRKIAEDLAEVVQKSSEFQSEQIRVIEILEDKKSAVSTQLTPLFKKVYGCLLGGAIGDTLGAPVEGIHYRQIEKKFGEVTEFLSMDNIGTDDTEMAELIIKTYLEKGRRISAEDFARTLLRGKKIHDHGSMCVANAYNLLLQEKLPARLTGLGNVDTGSALMGISPVGIFNLGNPDQAYLDALEIGSVHQRGMDVVCAGVFAALFAEAMKPAASVESVVECALRKIPKLPVSYCERTKYATAKEHLKKGIDIALKYDDVLAVREELYQEVTLWESMDPLEVLTLTLAVLVVAKGDPKTAVMGAANMGRDCDTIANLNGAITGALHGWDAFPEEWTQAIEEKVNYRFRNLSEKFCEVIIEHYSLRTQQLRDMDYSGNCRDVNK